MPDAAAFQQAFGAAFAGRVAVADPRLARALRVHRNTALRAAADALVDNHPVVRALVGDEAFEGAAIAFAAAHPPGEPRLCLYGEGFAGFVAAHPAFAALPFLADVAATERLVVEALFAADARASGGDEIALDLDAPLRLHPAARFAAFTSPAASLWRAHAPGAAADALQRIEWRGEGVLVTRPDHAVDVQAVPNAAIGFLSACAANRPLGYAAAAAGDALADVFALLVAAGAFA